MKRLKLTNIGFPSKGSVFTADLLYSVNLGNGIHKKFKNKADAVKFLNEVSKFLTYKMHECNELYISTFGYYRRAWFYFDHDKVTSKNDLAGLYKLERQCEDAIQIINNAFNLLYRRARSENGNYFVFTHFHNILHALETMVQNVNAVYENKSVAGINYELEILNHKIRFCRRTIDNYTTDLENTFTDYEKTELTIVQMA